MIPILHRDLKRCKTLITRNSHLRTGTSRGCCRVCTRTGRILLWVRRRPITNDTSRTRSSFTNDMALVKIPQRRINISIIARDETRACCGWFMLGIGSKSNPVRGTTLRGTRPGLSGGHLFRFRGVRSARVCHCLSSSCCRCRLRLPFLCTRPANPGPFIAFAFANI